MNGHSQEYLDYIERTGNESPEAYMEDEVSSRLEQENDAELSNNYFVYEDEQEEEIV